MKQQELVIVSGMSGSGKSVALRALEDSGFYCIDNLPINLLNNLVDCLDSYAQPTAVALDVRGGKAFEKIVESIGLMEELGTNVKLLILDASDDVLLMRFSETRRRHPLADPEKSLVETIAAERKIVAPLINKGYVIDTSYIRPTALAAWVRDFVGMAQAAGLQVMIESFGYKYGVPHDCDLVFDVRCLPNPHYDPLLKHKTGLEQAVISFMAMQPLSKALCQDISDYLMSWLPHYEKVGKSYFGVGIGCTGGRHRSVYVAEQLSAKLKNRWSVGVRHRMIPSNEIE